MRTHSPLILDVRELLEHPGVQRSLAFDAPVADMNVGLVQVVGDVHFDLSLEAIDGGVVIRGKMTGGYEGQCRRCLKDIRQPFEYKGAEVYRPAGDVWEEGYVMKDAMVDLDPMARDTIGLNLETDPLCRPDCPGLCPRCGADLNEGPCDCAEEGQIDLRWSALRELGRDLNR
jgi:uncharacterized protein